LDFGKVHLGGEDDVVWNSMECRNFDAHSYPRASQAPIGAMFLWNPKVFLNVSLCKTAALGKILISKEYLQ